MKVWTEFIDEDFLARLERIHLAAKSALSRTHVGAARSRRIGDGLEFADHRPYSPGDDPRFIDWACFARMERLLVRLFHQHSEADVGILLDVSGSMAPGGDRTKFNHARRLAAVLAYLSMSAHERVTIVPFAQGPLPPLRTGRNRGRILAVLEYLAQLTPGGRTDLPAAIKDFVLRHGSVGTVMLVSDLLDCHDELSRSLAQLRGAGAGVCVLQVYSPADASPPLLGPMLLEQAETGQRLAVHVWDGLLESYRSRWGAFQRQCLATCLSRAALYVPADTAVPVDQLVLLALRRAGILDG